MKDEEKVKVILGVVWAVVAVVVITIIVGMKPIETSFEGTCNTGLIGLDFRSEFDNQPYSDNITISTGCDGNGCFNEEREIKRYHQEWLPEKFNVKNIEGLTCDFKL